MKKTMIILMGVLSLVFVFNGMITKENTTDISRGTVIATIERTSDTTAKTTPVIVDTVNMIDSLNLSEYDQVYWWAKYWGKEYGVPYQVLLTIAWKETGWGSTAHWVPIESYSIKKGGRMDRLNASCNGTMQVIMSTAISMAAIHKLPKPTRDQMRHNIKINMQIATLLVKYLWEQYGNITAVFNAYNSGNPNYGYGPTLVSYLKTKYNLTPKDVKNMFSSKN